MMIALPWYLMAIGIVLILIGGFAGALSGAGDSPKTVIHERLSDEEIVNRLNEQPPLSLSSLMMGAGFLCLIVSFVWRVVLRFML